MGDGLGLPVGRKDPCACSMLSESEILGTKAGHAGKPCRPGYEAHILSSAFLVTNSEHRRMVLPLRCLLSHLHSFRRQRVRRTAL